MKKSLETAFVLLIVTAFSVSADIPPNYSEIYNTDFETGVPPGWSIVDYQSDDYTWTATDFSESGGFGYDTNERLHGLRKDFFSDFRDRGFLHGSLSPYVEEHEKTGKTFTGYKEE